MHALRTLFSGFDIPLAISAFILSLLGLVTMYSYLGDNSYFERQIIWIFIAFNALCIAAVPDYRFLRGAATAFWIYLVSVALLVAVLFVGEITLGAQSRFNLGLFSFQPVDLAKIALIITLAKYFSKRHIEIAHFRHILISGLYGAIIFVLTFIQPDFGSAIIIFGIWFGMVLVSGISFRHIAIVTVLGALAFGLLWSFGFQEYQKERVLTFLNPLADIQGAGYNAYQSTIAVGSGQIFGKGVGFGTQSKLEFLPEYETDFIFAAYAEEWGMIGVVVLFSVFGFVIYRILRASLEGSSNFERLFTVGVAIMFMSHFFVHVGINIGLLPVTGTTIPFLSYGGSHLVVECIALGMIMGMRKNRAPSTVRNSSSGTHYGDDL